MNVEQRVAKHYGYGDVAEAVLGAILQSGLDPDRLRPEDLAPVDEFHMRGRDATRELVAAMGLDASLRLLDVGSGLGGPARHVAAEVGCRVTGIDLVDEYVSIASVLSERCGLAERLDFHRGSALAMPFDDGSFDAAMTQHVAMNIADKPALYAEVRRVLRPGARFGIYDILRGPAGEPLFPVPWARDSSTSFLATPDELRELLKGAGFEIVSWADRTQDCLAWFERMVRRASGGAPPIQ